MKPDDLHWVVRTVVRKIMAEYDLPPDRKEDLTQEGYVKAVAVAGKHDPTRGKLTTFLYSAVRNHLKDVLAKMNKEVPIDNMDFPAEEDVSRDTRISLDQIQTKLSGRELEVFKLLRKGCTYREAGSKLGVSHEIIRRTLNEIKRKDW